VARGELLPSFRRDDRMQLEGDARLMMLKHRRQELVALLRRQRVETLMANATTPVVLAARGQEDVGKERVLNVSGNLQLPVGDAGLNLGSRASGTSKETEIKLTNVARASFEELLEDYRDFLRTRDCPQWDKEFMT
jgi:hypothetical protein